MKDQQNISNVLPKFLFKLLSKKSIFSFLIIAISLMFSSQDKNPVLAQTDPITVDVELVLSVDVSGSISRREFNLQHQGYIDAFKDPGLISAIESLPNGLAVTLQYWSNSAHDEIGWYLITDAASAYAFSDAIAAAARPSYGSTHLAEAINSATYLLLNNNYEGQALVIDVSGDGLDNKASVDSTDITSIDDYFSYNSLNLPNYLDGKSKCANGSYNARFNGSGKQIRGLVRVPIEHVICPPVQAARDAAVAEGITINGLAILSPNEVVDSGKTLDNFYNLPFIIGRDRFAKNREDQIDQYFENNVIGGDNAFVEVANGFADFGRAAIDKITQEITDAQEEIINNQTPPIIYAD